MSTTSMVALTFLGVSSTCVQEVEPRVRDGDDAEVGLGRGERVGGRGGLRVGQRVEQGGLADVGQTDDAELHGRLPSLLVSRVSRRRGGVVELRAHAPRVSACRCTRRCRAVECQSAVRGCRRLPLVAFQHGTERPVVAIPASRRAGCPRAASRRERRRRPGASPRELMPSSLRREGVVAQASRARRGDWRPRVRRRRPARRGRSCRWSHAFPRRSCRAGSTWRRAGHPPRRRTRRRRWCTASACS